MTKKTNKRSIRDIITRLRALPHWYYVVLGFIFLCLIVIFLLLPVSTTFSYAQKTCFYQPTVLPGLLNSRSKEFRIEPSKRLSIGGVTLAAMEMCLIPLKAPRSGVYSVSLSSEVLPFIKKSYEVSVPVLPEASIGFLEEKPLPIGHKLTISLSRKDTVHSYEAKFSNGQSTKCESEGFELVCDITKLRLGQGKKYVLSINRYFDGQMVDTVSSQSIKTLSAIKVMRSSIVKNQLVFSKPDSLTIDMDKRLESATAALEKLGNKNSSIPVEVMVKDKRVTIAWDKELSRRSEYKLTLVDAVGRDGSNLSGFHTIKFSTSGGPQVKSISIGTYKVPLGATAVLTFDQPISRTQDIRKAISATGGAIVTGKKGKTVLVSFTNVPRCRNVTITVNENLVSKYGISGGSTWTYNTRTICQKVTTIGTSVAGRPINAYWFGEGAKTVVYTGGIHGNEASTYYLMQLWINNLEANIHSVPANVRAVVIPLINPDGFYSGTRTNSRNVDLNRNFGTSDWKKNITDVYNNPFPGGGGAKAFSEPESKAIANFVSSLNPSLVVSFHSTGSLVLANNVGNASGKAEAYARASGYYYTKNTGDSFDYSVSGTADDYYGQNLGVPSILVELGSDTYHQYGQNGPALWRMLN